MRNKFLEMLCWSCTLVLLAGGGELSVAQEEKLIYRYDALNRLIEVRSLSEAIFYTYDAAGNRTRQERVGVPDAAIAKTHTGNFLVGTNGIYTIAISNIGSASTSGTITVTDTLPNGLTFVSAVGTSWTCSAYGQTVTCTRTEALAPGVTTSLTLTVSVGTTGFPVVVNIARVSAAGDTNPANDSANDLTTVLGIPDLSLSKSHTGDFRVGINGVYNLTVSNVGSGATTGRITLTDTLPTGLAFISAVGPAWTCTTSGQAVTCYRNNFLAAGATTGVALTVLPSAAAIPGVTNTASVSTPGDTNTSNNSASDITVVPTVLGVPDLSISKTHNGNFFVGVSGVYTLTVTNVGTAATTGNIAVADTLPNGLAFLSGTGTNWSCSAAGQVVTCSRSTPMAVLASSSITLTVSVGTAAGSALTNTATVSVAGDTNNTNNIANDATVVINCTYTVSPTEQRFSELARTGNNTSVTAAAGCKWAASSNSSWMLVTAGDSGTGNGTIGYSVTANTGESQRTGAITLKNHNLQDVGNLIVTQAGTHVIHTPPTIELETDSRTYLTGNTLMLTKWKMTNGSESKTVDYRTWIRLPDGTSVSVLRVDQLSLSPGQIIDLTGGAPLAFITFGAGMPVGQWEIGNQLIDNLTGEVLSADLDRVTVYLSAAETRSPKAGGSGWERLIYDNLRIFDSGFYTRREYPYSLPITKLKELERQRR